MRLAPTLLAALLAELGRLVAGGKLQLYSGGAPARVGETPQTAGLLVEMRIRSATVGEDGLILDVTAAVGRVTGDVRWYQVREPAGAVVLDGEVGGDTGQLRVTPSGIVQGGRVDGAALVIGWGD